MLSVTTSGPSETMSSPQASKQISSLPRDTTSRALAGPTSGETWSRTNSYGSLAVRNIIRIRGRQLVNSRSGLREPRALSEQLPISAGPRHCLGRRVGAVSREVRHQVGEKTRQAVITAVEGVKKSVGWRTPKVCVFRSYCQPRRPQRSAPAEFFALPQPGQRIL